MADTGLTRSPKVQKGALVQLVESLNIPLPNIVPFQFNPEMVTRSMTPFNPLEVGESDRGLSAPQAQPFDPEQKISMKIELDATDDLDADNPIAGQFGVRDRVAALEKMLFAESSPLGEVLEAAAALLGNSVTKRRSVPITFLIFGVGRMVPVRLLNYSIEEKMFLPSLYAVQADVTLEMQVLTPETFQCASGPSVEIAKTVYELHRKQESALALLHVANTTDELLALLPF